MAVTPGFWPNARDLAGRGGPWSLRAGRESNSKPYRDISDLMCCSSGIRASPNGQNGLPKCLQ